MFGRIFRQDWNDATKAQFLAAKGKRESLRRSFGQPCTMSFCGKPVQSGDEVYSYSGGKYRAHYSCVHKVVPEPQPEPVQEIMAGPTTPAEPPSHADFEKLQRDYEYLQERHKELLANEARNREQLGWLKHLSEACLDLIERADVTGTSALQQERMLIKRNLTWMGLFPRKKVEGQ